jgi:prepilin-type N-terminal cleavage/methylation domain-containing protein
MRAGCFLARQIRRPGGRGQAARRAFTIIELLMVIAAMAIIAGVVVPQVTCAIDDAKNSATLRDLRELTMAIERYRLEHNGGAPDQIQNGVLIQLTEKTDADGNVGSGPKHIYGPYAREMPTNALNGIARVFRINSAPPATLTNRAGWVYHPASGQIWAGLHPKQVSLGLVQAEGNL